MKYSIKAEFNKFRHIDLSELIGAIGVYVIWDSKTIARPTYIGEGNILKRFSDHCQRDGRRFAKPWDGYVAILDSKKESKAVERLLLDVANDTDRSPSANSHPGAASVVSKLCDGGTLLLTIKGYDPLLPPSESRPLSIGKSIKAKGDDGNYLFNHSWRLRKLRT